MAEQIAQCPKCMTSFRVTPSQLQMAGGRVRCGYCRHVFDAEKYFVEAQGHSLDFGIEDTAAIDSVVEDDIINIADPELNLAFDDNGVVVDAQLTESLSVGTLQDNQRKPEKETALAFIAATQELETQDAESESRAEDMAFENTLDLSAEAAISPEQRFSPRSATDNALDAFDDSLKQAAASASEDPDALLDLDDLASFNEASESAQQPPASEQAASNEDVLDLADFDLAALEESPQENTEPEAFIEPVALNEASAADDDALADLLSVETEDSLLAEPEPDVAPESTLEREPRAEIGSEAEFESEAEPAAVFDLAEDAEEALDIEALDLADDIAEPVFKPADVETSDAESEVTTAHDEQESSRVIEELLGEVELLAEEPQRKAEPAIKRISEPVPEFEELATELEFDELDANGKAIARASGGLQWAGIAGSVALFLMFCAQYVAFNFTELARNTTARPALESICSVTGCDVPAFSDISKIKSEQLTVRTHPELDGALVVDVIVTNGADLPQPFPALQLTFFDIRSEPVATRRFYPGEYLHGELRGLTSMPNKNPVHLALEVMDPGAQAINYELKLVQLP